MEEYWLRVLTGLAGVPMRAIAAALRVSQGCAARVRKGETVPHARHRESLARLGVSTG
jgi:hypothetical protein